MPDALRKAKKLAERLRYSDDAVPESSDNGNGELTATRSYFYQNGLCISKEVTPVLSERMKNVCQRLQIPDTAVEAFVYPSSEIQAGCISDGAGACVIRFSSTLIETLDSEEFEFVAGHELGHFLLGHGASNDSHDSLEYFMQSRAQEISADRIGLIACSSLDSAIRAMMKTISGLTSRHLRFDAGTFVSQLKKSPSHSNARTSHPPMLVRCRALLWFSTSGCLNTDKDTQGNVLTDLDKRIEADFRNYVDGPTRKRIEEVKENLSMWISVRQMAKDNNFSKSEQAQFAKLFGKKALESMKSYLQSIPVAQIREAIDERIDNARKELVATIPKASSEEIAKIELIALNRLP